MVFAFLFGRALSLSLCLRQADREAERQTDHAAQGLHMATRSVFSLACAP